MNKRATLVALPLLLAAIGCAPEDTDNTATDAGSSPTDSTQCEKDNLPLLTPGTLTIGTDSPAYEPYFRTTTRPTARASSRRWRTPSPTSSASPPTQVTWVTVPFNKSYAPGAKDFDFDINQISITPKRQKAVDFSDGYYTVNRRWSRSRTHRSPTPRRLAELAGREARCAGRHHQPDFIPT